MGKQNLMYLQLEGQLCHMPQIPKHPFLSRNVNPGLAVPAHMGPWQLLQKDWEWWPVLPPPPFLAAELHEKDN